MNKIVKGVIFDWAGTTVDYGCVGPVAVIQRLFKKKGIILTNEDVRKDMGLLKIDHLRLLIKIPSVRTQIEKTGLLKNEEEYIQNIYNDFEPEIKRVLPEYSSLVPNLKKTLEFLRTNQLKIGSTSGYTQEMMDILAPLAKTQGYSPDYWISSSQVPNGRPYPWMIYRNAEILGLNELHKVVKIGDTVSDINEGKNAGCWTIGLLEGSSEVGISLEERKSISIEKLNTLKQKAKKAYEQANADFIINSISEVPETIELIHDKILKGERPQNLAQLPKQHYHLFTPGPISTSQRVKLPMMVDFGSREQDYLEIVQDVRKKLTKIIAPSNPEAYTTVIMQGSGTFGVESAINSCVPIKTGKLLVLANGVYGKRMAEIAARLGKQFTLVEFSETEIIDVSLVETALKNDPLITHVSVVHSETTTGILNPIKDICQMIKKYKKIAIVDSISSLGGVPFDANELGADFVIGSANKCFQGVPGFAFIIAKIEEIKKIEKNSSSLSLDLFDQWQYTEKGKGSFRYTTPTHTIVAFREALIELEEEGGVAVRNKRYTDMQKQLVDGMRKLGFKELELKGHQGPIITTFHSPKTKNYDFEKFYNNLKAEKCVIYPGKLTKLDTFRIGTIGNMNKNDIERLLVTISKYKVE